MKSHFQLIKKRKPLGLLKFIAFSLFWKENRPKWSQYCFEILSNIQIIAIILYGPSLFNLPASQNTFVEFLKNIIEVFTFLDVFDSVSTSLNNVIFVFLCVYFIFAFCTAACIGVKYYKKQKIHGACHLFITHWAQLHHSLFFWVFNIFTMSLLTRSAKRIAIFNLSYNNNAPIIVVATILTVLNYAMGMITATFCYDPFLTSNPFASYNSQFQKSTFLFKAIMGPTIILVHDLEILKWLFSTLTLALCFLRQEFLLWDTPFYKYSGMKVTSLMTSSALSIALTNMIVVVLIEFDLLTDLDIIYIELAMNILFLWLAKLRLHRKIHAYISMPEGKLLTQKDIFRKILALNDLGDQSQFLVNSNSNKVCNEPMLLLMGSLLDHHKNCKYERCACGYILRDETKNNKRHKGLFEIHTVSGRAQGQMAVEILNKAIKKFKRNSFFKILLAYILLKEQNNLTACLFTLFSIDESHLTIQEDIIVYWLSKQLEEGIFNFAMQHCKDKDKTRNIKQIVGAEKRSNKLFMLIENNTRAYIDLWNYFIKTNISLGAFVVKSGELEKQAKKIEKIWNQISNEYDIISPYAYGLYCTYLAIIRNMPSKAEKIYTRYICTDQQKHSRFDDILSQINIDNKCDVILYVSMSRERLGKVVYASRNIYEELGWSQSEVVDKNIKTIQPTFIKERHDQILTNHIEGTKKQPVAFKFEGVIQKKEGHSIPVNAHVTFFPYIETEPIYAGIFNKIELVGEYIIIGSDGAVESFSEGIARDLKLNIFQKINIRHICPNFESAMSKNDSSNKKTDKKSLHNVEKDNVTLTFQSVGPGLNKTLLVYAVKIEPLFVLRQPFIKLYLYEQKSAYLTFETCYNFEKIETQPANHEAFLDKIPVDLGEEPNTQRGDYTKRSDCKLLDTKRQSEKVTSLEPLDSKMKNYLEPYSPKKEGVTVNSKHTLSNLLPQENRLVSESKRIKIKKKPIEKQITFGIHPSSMSASSKHRTDLNDKVEQAVYTVPKQRYMKILDFLISIFGIFCIVLITIHLLDSNSQLNSTLKKIDLMSTSFKESVTLVYTRTLTRQFELITKGIISDQRFILAGVPSWKTVLKSNLLANTVTLNSLNEKFQDSLSVLDEGAQELIYDYQTSIKGVNIIPVDANIFQIITAIANAANKIARMDQIEITTEKPEVMLILNYTVNDPLVMSETIADIVVEDCKKDLYHIEEKILIFLVLTVGVWTSILFLLLVDMKNFVTKRNQFIELLLRIDEEIVQNHLKVVSRFYHYLHSSIFNPQTYVEIKGHLSVFLKVIEAKGSIKRAQYRSKKGLNTEMIKGLVSTTLTIVVFASVFPVTNLASGTNMDLFVQKIDRAVEFNRQRLNSNLLNLAILEYIGENNSTTIRNKPIEQEMVRIFDILKKAPDQYNEIVEKTRGINDPVVQSLIKGNMCQAISSPDLPTSYCETLGDYIGAKGLVTVMSYLLRSYEESKVLYDESNHTLEAAFAASDTKARIMGELMNLYALKALEIVEEVLKDDLRMSVMDYKSLVIVIIAAYVVIYIVLGAVLSVKFWKGIKKERASWRKIMRQIPFPILMSNKPLKAYLVNDCDHILDSFKNII